MRCAPCHAGQSPHGHAQRPPRPRSWRHNGPHSMMSPVLQNAQATLPCAIFLTLHALPGRKPCCQQAHPVSPQSSPGAQPLFFSSFPIPHLSRACSRPSAPLQPCPGPRPSLQGLPPRPHQSRASSRPLVLPQSCPSPTSALLPYSYSPPVQGILQVLKIPLTLPPHLLSASSRPLAARRNLSTRVVSAKRRGCSAAR